MDERKLKIVRATLNWQQPYTDIKPFSTDAMLFAVRDYLQELINLCGNDKEGYCACKVCLNLRKLIDEPINPNSGSGIPF